MNYLHINGITLAKPHFKLIYSVLGVSVEDIEVGDALSAEEWPSYCAMKPCTFMFRVNAQKVLLTYFHISPASPENIIRTFKFTKINRTHHQS